jgi:hypothetical protein
VPFCVTTFVRVIAWDRKRQFTYIINSTPHSHPPNWGRAENRSFPIEKCERFCSYHFTVEQATQPMTWLHLSLLFLILLRTRWLDCVNQKKWCIIYLSSHSKYCGRPICNKEVLNTVDAPSALHQKCLFDNLLAYVDWLGMSSYLCEE